MKDVGKNGPQRGVGMRRRRAGVQKKGQEGRGAGAGAFRRRTTFLSFTFFSSTAASTLRVAPRNEENVK